MKLNDRQIMNPSRPKQGRKSNCLTAAACISKLPRRRQNLPPKYHIVHVEEDRIRAAYLRTDYMNERHEIMQ